MTGLVRRLLEVMALLALLAGAVALRVTLAGAWDYVYDEYNTSIPLAESISFDADARNLPLRAQNHPALPAYFVKFSIETFGTESPLAYRGVHIAASLLAVCLVFGFVRSVYGPGAALWAAALLAFNEYFLAVSSRATAHVPYLLFVTIAISAYGVFLARGRVWGLYVAGAAVGLAFYAKEHAALLVPVFFVTLLLPPYRRWLRGPHAYLACALFVLVIAPDVAWNLAGDAAEGQATYSNQLQRVGGLGMSQYPAAFYARGVVAALQPAITGTEFDDNTAEYQSMNPVLGVLLLLAMAATTWRVLAARRGEPLHGYLLLVFWGIFGFFSLIRRGDPAGLDPVSWIWVEASMVPAVMVTGARLAEARGWWRVPVWGGGAAAVAYAVVRMLGTL